jgi:hypothetical protein
MSTREINSAARNAVNLEVTGVSPLELDIAPEDDDEDEEAEDDVLKDDEDEVAGEEETEDDEEEEGWEEW